MNSENPNVYNLLDNSNIIPSVIWLTGLSGSGKTTIAEELSKQLRSQQIFPCILDGDQLRSGLNKDLGFTQDDRYENIRRTAEIAKILNQQEFVVITALISPLQSQRDMAKEIIGKHFYDIFIDTPFDICKKRDVKGLYKAEAEGKIKNFTGTTSNYEPPKSPFIKLTYPFDLKESSTEIINKTLSMDLKKSL